jgi:protein-S-isoprenylcysteine O-methyltransferase Ste14
LHLFRQEKEVVIRRCGRCRRRQKVRTASFVTAIVLLWAGLLGWCAVRVFTGTAGATADTSLSDRLVVVVCAIVCLYVVLFVITNILIELWKWVTIGRHPEIRALREQGYKWGEPPLNGPE